MIKETDYLIVGAGAMAMAFADTILKEQPNSTIALVEKRSGPRWSLVRRLSVCKAPSASFILWGELGKA